MLDCILRLVQDEQIRSLERDIENLEKEKVTFSVIAEENMHYRDDIKKMEDRISEVCATRQHSRLSVMSSDRSPKKTRRMSSLLRTWLVRTMILKKS